MAKRPPGAPAAQHWGLTGMALPGNGLQLSWSHIAQRHWALALHKASLPQPSEALSTDCTHLHGLHFQYYCSMSLKSVSLSCNIPTQPRRSMAYHHVCSLPITSCYLTQYSPLSSLFETLRWVCCFQLCCFTPPLASLWLTVPELVFCIVSLLISLFITTSLYSVV